MSHGGCDPLSTCTNLPGSFECGACPPGYTGTGSTGCVANPCSGVPDSSCPCLRVSENGDDAAAVASYGQTPFRNVQTAIDFADAHRTVATNVCVAGGADCSATVAYAEDFRMRDGINVFGSFEPSAWSRCYRTTALEPLASTGVLFGGDIQSSTVLDQFVVRTFPVETAAGVSVQGARGVALSGLAIQDSADNFHVYGVDASGGAELALESVEVSIGLDEPALENAAAAGVRVADSAVALKDVFVRLTNKDASTCAFCLENASGSSLEGARAFMGGASTAAGIRVVGGDGLTIAQTNIEIDASSYGNTRGIELVDAGDVSLSGSLEAEGRTSVGLYAVRTRVVSDARILSEGTDSAIGVRLEDAVGSAVSQLIASSSGEAVGMWLLGENGDIALPSVKVSGPSTTGVLIDDCAGASPVVRATVEASTSGGEATGIRAAGDCHPHIESSDITLAGTNATTLTAIGCGADSHCSIFGNDLRMNEARTSPGILSATGIACAACEEISDNLVGGLTNTGTTIRRSTSPVTTGILSQGTSTLIARNRVGAGCGYRATGMRAAGRIENNVISGGAGCALTSVLGGSYVLTSTGLEALGADVHSNAIVAGAAGDQPTSGCTTIAVSGSFSSLRDNEITKGHCSPHALVDSGSVIENNYFSGTINHLGGALTAEELNLASSAASGNFSSGSLIDAGTPAGAPADDLEGKPRNPLKPDVGPLELGDYCPEEPCSGHGQCFEPIGGERACECEPGYMNDGPLTCVVDGCYANGGCDPLVTCTHLPGGGRTCGDCPPGYSGSGETACTDIDECAVANGGCDALTTCTNVPGGRTCGPCPDGYAGSGEEGCFDYCLVDNGGCDPLTYCAVLGGERVCSECPPGMTGSGETGCSAPACDSNPCVNGGLCIGLPGGDYTCDCPPGLSGHDCEVEPVQLVTAGFHACGLFADGGVRCWGQDGPEREMPDDASGPFVDLIDTGALCGLRTDATIACWGDAAYGLELAPAGTFTYMASAETNACAIRTDGTLACWGYANQGINNPPTGTFTDVQLYGLTACALRTDGTLACWGYANEGVTSPPSGEFASFAVGVFHGCALRLDGTLACWGSNAYGEATPPSGTFTQVISGQGASCALRTDGALLCWGSDDPGFGAAPVGSFEELWATTTEACGRRVDGTVICWGANHGPGKVVSSEALHGVVLSYLGGCGLTAANSVVCWNQQVVAPGKAYRETKGGCRLTYDGKAECDSVAAPPGVFTTLGGSCGLRPDGTLAWWGSVYSDNPALPAGTFKGLACSPWDLIGIRTDGTLARGDAETLPAGTFLAVAADQSGKCGLRTDGTLTCWNGALGNSPSGTFQALDVGYNTGCAVRTDGTIACWQASYNPWNHEPPAGPFVAVSVGDMHACALRPDRSVECWGDNVYGQASPPSGSFDSVDANGYATCGVTTDRKVRCWGSRRR